MNKETLFAELCARAPEPPSDWTPPGCVEVPRPLNKVSSVRLEMEWADATGGVIPDKFKGDGVTASRAKMHAMCAWYSERRNAAIAHNDAVRVASRELWRVEYATRVIKLVEGMKLCE